MRSLVADMDLQDASGLLMCSAAASNLVDGLSNDIPESAAKLLQLMV
jgi:hypothetical protein